MVTRTKLPARPLGLALGLIALSTTAGCAHFRDAHERALRDQGYEQPVAQTAPPAPAPVAAPIATPVPVAAPPAQTAPSPAQTRKADRAEQKAKQAQDDAERRTERQKSKAEAKLARAATPQSAPAALRQPVFSAPETAPAAPPPAAPPPPVTSAPADVAPAASGTAIVIFANVSGARCGACETLKISVAPAGKVLIERGHGAQESWRYKRSVAHVRPERAAAFAARLAAMRPVGKQVLACPAPATQDDGLTIEWIEAERHDQLSVNPGCSASVGTLLHAPDLLGLRQLAFPWGAAR